MGIWMELGIFLVVLAWGFWQLHDVRKAQADSRAAAARQRSGVQAPTGSDTGSVEEKNL